MKEAIREAEHIHYILNFSQGVYQHYLIALEYRIKLISKYEFLPSQLKRTNVKMGDIIVSVKGKTRLALCVHFYSIERIRVALSQLQPRRTSWDVEIVN